MRCVHTTLLPSLLIDPINVGVVSYVVLCKAQNSSLSLFYGNSMMVKLTGQKQLCAYK